MSRETVQFTEMVRLAFAKTIPTCPVHKRPMVQDKSGNWFCPKCELDAFRKQKVSKPA